MDGWMDDGWMDGWRRPTHMRSHVDELQGTSPVTLRRLPGELHSVAQQASFDIASGRNFKGFWSDFGRFSEAQMDARHGF